MPLSEGNQRLSIGYERSKMNRDNTLKKSGQVLLYAVVLGLTLLIMIPAFLAYIYLEAPSDSMVFVIMGICFGMVLLAIGLSLFGALMLPIIKNKAESKRNPQNAHQP